MIVSPISEVATGDAEPVWPLVFAGFGVIMICAIITLAWKIHQRKTKPEKEKDEPEITSEKMIIRPPSGK